MKSLLIFLTLCLFSTVSFIGCSSNKATDEGNAEIEAILGDKDDEGEGEDFEKIADKEADEKEDDKAQGETPEPDIAEAQTEDSSLALTDEINDEMDEITDAPVIISPVVKKTRKLISVKKIKKTPFYRGGILANAVYLVREGDSLVSIAEKIYGLDSSGELLIVNAHLKRGVSVGDKVYYNSPQRQEDSSQILTFYEDRGLSPETYISKEGDNIRRVAKKLLGHSRSWMEIYATNAVDSKGEMPLGTELRYWSKAGNQKLIPVPVAQVEPPELNTAVEETGGLEETLDVPESRSLDLPKEEVSPAAVEELPPPPPLESDPVAELPPPPLESNPVAELPPPPAPERPKIPQAFSSDGYGIESLDQNTILIIGVGIMVLLGIIIFIVRRRKSAQADVFEETVFQDDFEEKTQVGRAP